VRSRPCDASARDHFPKGMGQRSRMEHEHPRNGLLPRLRSSLPQRSASDSEAIVISLRVSPVQRNLRSACERFDRFAGTAARCEGAPLRRPGVVCLASEGTVGCGESPPWGLPGFSAGVAGPRPNHCSPGPSSTPRKRGALESQTTSFPTVVRPSAPPPKG
jgi:hypothetical protein